MPRQYYEQLWCAGTRTEDNPDGKPGHYIGLMTPVTDPVKYGGIRTRNSKEGTEDEPFKIAPGEDRDQCFLCLAEAELALTAHTQDEVNQSGRGVVTRSMMKAVNREDEEDEDKEDEDEEDDDDEEEYEDEDEDEEDEDEEVVNISEKRIITRSMKAAATTSEERVTRSKKRTTNKSNLIWERITRA
ncbi:hypothetical protein HD806DRAFT_401484 [Xylariaceae sp. AK1471]|nr:hypothetical protein HD806DRAFT_401484 [Xylariaceae sp. AK1471]